MWSAERAGVGGRLWKLYPGGLPPGTPGGCSSSCPPPAAPRELEGWVLVLGEAEPDSGGSSALCPLLGVCPAARGGQHKWPWTEGEPDRGLWGAPECCLPVVRLL